MPYLAYNSEGVSFYMAQCLPSFIILLESMHINHFSLCTHSDVCDNNFHINIVIEINDKH